MEYTAYMIFFLFLLKKYWPGIVIAILVFGVVFFLFLNNTSKIVAIDLLEVGEVASDDREKISFEESKELVKKIEMGETVPGENMDVREDDVPDTVKVSEDHVVTDVDTNFSDAQEADAVKNKPTNIIANKQEKEEKIEASFSIVDQLVSFGFERASKRVVDTIVIHSTYNAIGGDPYSVKKIIDIYKSYGVAPQYLIARDGGILRLVEEKNIAYHAGESRMPDGRSDVNAFSIGIEVIGKDDGNPSDEQYDALKNLITDIKKRHDIQYILGHSDIAPGRKTDPWGFSWNKIGKKKK